MNLLVAILLVLNVYTESADTGDNKASVDIILAATRSGFDLGFDRITNDPRSRQHIIESDEVAAARFVRNRLCSLGLSSCDQAPTSNKDFTNTGRDVPESPSKNDGSTKIIPIGGNGNIVEHIHHHVIHPASPANPASIGIGGGNDGKFDQFQQKPISSTNFGPGGSFPESPLPPFQNHKDPNRVIECRCVPINNCPTHDIMTGTYGDYDREIGNGRPNAGSVGINISPRTKHGSSSQNETKEDLQRSMELNFSEVIPEDAIRKLERTKRDLGSDAKTRLPKQRILSKNCEGGLVCCRSPHTVQHVESGFGQGNGQCGKRNARGITGRITNPNPGFHIGDTEYGEYPWQAAILKRDSNGKDSVFLCAGSLIDSRHVITAAHCLKGENPKELRIRLGEWDVNSESEFYPTLDFDAGGFVTHPEFYAGNLFNDVAILRLEGLVDFRQNPHVSPVCIPPTNHEFGGQRCFVTGWGKDAFGKVGKYQNVLKEVDLPVLHHSDCQQKLKRTRLGQDFVLHPGFLCAGGEEGRDACEGDGGGPLVCDVHGTWQLAGIISWGVPGCGQRDVPGVYVKVSHYRDWIRQIIGA